jgi:formylglycine-generating enzyme required for sulfatase activity
MSSVGKPVNSDLANLTTCTFETVSVDSNGEIIVRQSGSASCLVERLAVALSLDLVLIPGGTFMMGDNAHHPDEQPIRQVTLSPFYMSKYAITQAQYRQVMGEHLGNGWGADYPVEKINWDDAIAFCTKLSQKTGKQYSLPSEAQWEYACRAQTTSNFHFGETITTDLVNYNGEYPYNGAPVGQNRDRSTPVGTFPPNVFGLYDMHGNVWEWCLDRYQPNYLTAPIDGSAVLDIPESAGNSKRVMRGGAWDYVAKGCRSAVRCSLDSSLRMNGCGFRVILTTLD